MARGTLIREKWCFSKFNVYKLQRYGDGGMSCLFKKNNNQVPRSFFDLLKAQNVLPIELFLIYPNDFRRQILRTF